MWEKKATSRKMPGEGMESLEMAGVKIVRGSTRGKGGMPVVFDKHLILLAQRTSRGCGNLASKRLICNPRVLGRGGLKKRGKKKVERSIM